MTFAGNRLMPWSWLEGSPRPGSAWTLCCPIVNFFETRTSAEAYLAQRPEFDGSILSIPEAITVGRAIFEELLG